MADQDRLAVAAAELSHSLREKSRDDVLYDLSVQVKGLLGTTAAGVSLADDGSLRTCAATDEVGVALGRLQEESREGPGVDAHRTGTTILVDDLRRHPMYWPRVGAKALELGVNAMGGLPMHLAGAPVGALSLYDERPRLWTREEVAAAQVLANLAAGCLGGADEPGVRKHAAEQVGTARPGAAFVDQAVGVLAHERAVARAQALQLLEDHARAHRTSVDAVARAVVELGLRP
jgi:hypothetical protein